MKAKITTYVVSDEQPVQQKPALKEDLVLSGTMTPEIIKDFLGDLFDNELRVGTRGPWMNRTKRIVIEFTDSAGEG
jgi:hypothetical protein